MNVILQFPPTQKEIKGYLDKQITTGILFDQGRFRTLINEQVSQQLAQNPTQEVWQLNTVVNRTFDKVIKETGAELAIETVKSLKKQVIDALIDYPQVKKYL